MRCGCTCGAENGAGRFYVDKVVGPDSGEELPKGTEGDLEMQGSL